MNELTATLSELVEISSVTGTEGRLCTYVAERLLPGWGMEAVERIGNSLLVARRSGRPMIALVGHIDTVPDQGQGAVRVEGGRLYGLGASDMKAGVAVLVHLLEDEEVAAGPYDVVGIFYDGEEGPSEGNGLESVLAQAAWLRETELAVVLEPTDLELQLGCLGVVNARVTFLGKAAHSARPWLGENAVTKAGEWLTTLHRRRPEPVTVAGLEFQEVFTVTLASGGVAANVVPGRFDLNLNYRFAPHRSLDEAEGLVRELASGADEVEVVDRALAGTIPEQNPHLERLEAITRTPRRPKQAWTDVARLGEHGIPAVNYGPGETAQAHQVTESVALANLEVAFENLKEFLTRTS